jgi:DNA-binding Xre family transcriptional regulator
MTIRTVSMQNAQLEGKKKQTELAQILEMTKHSLTILANVDHAVALMVCSDQDPNADSMQTSWH